MSYRKLKFEVNEEIRKSIQSGSFCLTLRLFSLINTFCFLYKQLLGFFNCSFFCKTSGSQAGHLELTAVREQWSYCLGSNAYVLLEYWMDHDFLSSVHPF